MEVQVFNAAQARCWERRLTLALLIFSGRRCCEIRSGKSIFRHGSTPYSVQFHGQAKVMDSFTYEIPLLCSAEAFLSAYERLRALQGHRVVEHSEATTTGLQQELNDLFRVTEMISPGRARQLGWPEDTLIDAKLTPHDLRRLYANAVYCAYDYEACGASRNAVLEWCLGHDDMSTSLSYTS